MASYNGKTVKQLKEILKSRGLNYHGKNRAGFIQQLVDDDEKVTSYVVAEEDNEEEEVEFPHMGGAEEPIPKSPVSESTRNLELTLEIRKLEIEMLKLQQIQSDSVSSSTASVNLSLSNVKTKLPEMTPTSDVVMFFGSLERTLQINGVNRNDWSKVVPTVLNDKCLKIYSKLSVEECMNYDTIKSAIFDACKVSAHCYLRQLQSAARTGTESYRDFVVRLQDLQTNYFDCRNIVDFASLRNDNLMVIFMASLPPAVAEFVRGREPRDLKECAHFADLCYSISLQSKGSKQGQQGLRKPYDQKKPGWIKHRTDEIAPVGTTGATGGLSGTADPTVIQSTQKSVQVSKKNSQIVCYLCNTPGHVKAHCPKNPNRGQGQVKQTAGFITQFSDIDKCKYLVPIFLNNNPTPLVSYRDTGAQVSICQTSIIEPSCYTNKTMNIAGIGGQIVEVPIAKIQLWSPRFKCRNRVTAEVAVMQKTPFDVPILLGNDVFDKNSEISDVISVNIEHEQPVLPLVSNERETDMTDKLTDKGVQTDLLVGPYDDESQASDLPVSSKLTSTHTQLFTPDAVAASTRGRSVRSQVKSHDGKARQLQRTARQPSEPTMSDKNLDNGLSVCQASQSDASMETALPAQSSSIKSGLMNHINRNVHQRYPSDTCSVGADMDKERDRSGQSRTDQTGSASDVLVGKADDDGFTIKARDDRFDSECRRLSEIDPDILNRNFFVPQTAEQAKFAGLQRTDPKLATAFIKAANGKSGFVLHNGILYKTKPRHIQSENELILVLPDAYKTRVFRVAHDNVNSGFHFGYKRTFLKIWRTFYIPKAEIKQYCATCPTCQRLAPKFKRERAEMIIPTIEEEFGMKWVIDIMGGDLNRLSKKDGNHKYVLICVDSCTRYVELFALPNLKAKTVTDVLLEQLISRYRCKTLVYDQQSSFVSDLMMSVLKLMRTKADIAVAGYHAKTSLAERTVRTVEKCLKPYISDNHTNWKAILPWLAFQLRQMPCETTGYSPHMLVYGKNFPDSLDDLMNEFIGRIDSNEKRVKKNVLTYVSELKQNIEKANEMAKINAEKSHARTKLWWDKISTKNKHFEPGSKVLILEPTDSRKLFAQWSEPKEIVRKISDRNYEIRLDERSVKIFHVNQLRQWNERVDFVAPVVIKADRVNNVEDHFISVIDDDVSEGPLKFNIETSLPIDQQNRMRALLNDFVDVFRPSLGKTDLAVHHIKLTDDIPCVKPQYRIAEALKEPFEQEVNRLLEAGVLIECHSQYRSPIIPILKPDNSLRLVCDYKFLNAKTVDDLYPMTDPYEVITKAAGKHFISKIDLTSSFFQIPLAEECYHLTAFSCFLGSFCFTRAAQGLKNSPRTMQRLMDTILRGTSKFASSLLDDIVIFSNSMDDHEIHVRTILERLRAANLTASLKKSDFLLKSMTVLGHCLEDGLIKPSQKHIENVLKIGPQTTKQGVRALLGLLGYHRHMIPAFAELTLCFTDLLKKNQPEKGIKWEQRHSDALEKVKSILTSNPVLVPPRHDRDYIIMSDATDRTFAAILIQVDDNGVERNVAYFSRKLLPNQRNYSVMEKEGLGIIMSVLHWHNWIWGHKILVLTDHRALEFLDSTAQHNSRIARWKIILSNYDIETRYRKGSEHINCDSLSRVEMLD